MKKISILVLSLVLTAAMFTGCGCTNSNGNASTPTGMTETMPTAATTAPTTRPTTAPTTPPTAATTQPDTGNGPLEDSASNATGSTGAVEETEGASGTVRGRERNILPNGGR